MEDMRCGRERKVLLWKKGGKGTCGFRVEYGGWYVELVCSLGTTKYR